MALEREHVTSTFEHHMARLMSLLQEEQRWLDILDWAKHWIKLEYDRNLAILKMELDEPTPKKFWTKGNAMSLDRAIAFALEK